MTSKTILCLALVVPRALLGYCAIAQSPVKSDEKFGFPILPPITNANPAIRQPLVVHVPTKLKIKRTKETLSVEIDTNSFASTNLTVGTNMITGVENKYSVYPEKERSWPGGINPLRQSLGLGGGTDFNLGKTIWHTKTDNIPLPGKKYRIELKLILFETDIPPQHVWNPYGKNYKVLWEQTLRQSVE